MLNRLPGGPTLDAFLRHVSHVKSTRPNPPESPPSVITIVHAGGIVEQYYMAVPAARVMEKYPSFILARPEIFRQPWQSVVHPEEILVPGQKFYVIPCRTVRKLRRRIRLRSGELSSRSFSGQYRDVSGEAITVNGPEQLGNIQVPKRRHDSADRSSWSSAGIKNEDKSSGKAARSLGKAHGSEVDRKPVTSSLPRRTAKKTVTWEPTLPVISESDITSSATVTDL